MVEPAWEPLPARAVAARTADERLATVSALIAWADVAGAALQSVAARVDGSGNVAMYATRAINPGTQVFALPRRLMIIRELAPHAELAAWLAESRDPESPWHAYLADLPPHMPELPLYRTARELAALAGTTAHAHVMADRRELLDAHDRTQLPLADFAWGWSIVRSRAFHAPGSFEPHLALMPVVDLFDHGHGDTTWTYDQADATFVITAERAIASGEPVTFPYGDLSNGQLLAHYGFTLPDERFAEALLAFEPSAVASVEVAVASRVDQRFAHALSVARRHAADDEDRALALLADAARRSIAMLANVPATGDPSWDANAARVRTGERAVLEQYAALDDRDSPLLRAYRAARDR